jgi:hypothetical protein
MKRTTVTTIAIVGDQQQPLVRAITRCSFLIAQQLNSVQKNDILLLGDLGVN